MNVSRWCGVALFAFFLAGCAPESPTSAPAPAPKPGEPVDIVKANREKLSAADQQLVAAQDFCPVMPDVRLGAMGVPIKLSLKGQDVFVCCRSCLKRAEADPDKTLASLEEIRKKAKSEKK